MNSKRIIKEMSVEQLEKHLKDLYETREFVKKRKHNCLFNISKEDFEENTCYTLAFLEDAIKTTTKILNKKKEKVTII